MILKHRIGNVCCSGLIGLNSTTLMSTTKSIVHQGTNKSDAYKTVFVVVKILFLSFLKLIKINMFSVNRDERCLKKYIVVGLGG